MSNSRIQLKDLWIFSSQPVVVIMVENFDRGGGGGGELPSTKLLLLNEIDDESFGKN